MTAQGHLVSQPVSVVQMQLLAHDAMTSWQCASSNHTVQHAQHAMIASTEFMPATVTHVQTLAQATIQELHDKLATLRMRGTRF